ncbi:uncharacterized protein [Dysidea avara]|uniref:uncharacterized protein n=1 Tax=Dysidea avara TaxID=196820 RepID=UPI00332A5435
MASRMNDNPWNEDSSLSGISLGKPQDVLTTLRNCGLKISGPKDDVKELPSVKLIYSLEKLHSTYEDLNKATCELNRHTLQRKYDTFIDVSVLDEQLRTLENLLEHFVTLIKQKDLLLQRLRNPMSGSPYLLIEAAFQRNLSVVLSSSADFVNNLSHYLALIRNGESRLKY